MEPSNATPIPRRRAIILPLLAALAVAACSPLDLPRAPTSTATVSAWGRIAAPPTTTDQPGSSQDHGRIGSRTFVKSVVDALRVRTLPQIAAESRPLEPLLARDTALYVLDGPVSASGYSWFQVVPVTARILPNGWVAAASRDGEAWIEPTDFRCPAIPTDFRALSRLSPGVGLACFARVPITVRGRVVECGCEVDGPVVSPGWFSAAGGSPTLLIDVGETGAPRDSADWFFLALDPDAELNADVALGTIVEVTGVYDHPSASTCTITEDAETSASLQCRLAFAVTRLTSVGT